MAARGKAAGDARAEVTPASQAARYEQFLEFAPDAIVGIGRDVPSRSATPAARAG
jgi:hypothetical protein